MNEIGGQERHFSFRREICLVVGELFGFAGDLIYEAWQVEGGLIAIRGRWLHISTTERPRKVASNGPFSLGSFFFHFFLFHFSSFGFFLFFFLFFFCFFFSLALLFLLPNVHLRPAHSAAICFLCPCFIGPLNITMASRVLLQPGRRVVLSGQVTTGSFHWSRRGRRGDTGQGVLACFCLIGGGLMHRIGFQPKDVRWNSTPVFNRNKSIAGNHRNDHGLWLIARHWIMIIQSMNNNWLWLFIEFSIDGQRNATSATIIDK